MVLTDVPDVVAVRVSSSVVNSDHSVVFIDVVLVQPILHQVCRQEVYPKNSVDWELIRGDVKGLNWNEFIRFSLARHCCVLLAIEFTSGQLWSEQETSLGLMTDVPWLIVRSREHIECGVVAGRRLIGRSIGGSSSCSANL